MSLAGKTLFITGGSRGIGLAIAKRAARDGANVVIAAKTAEPHPKLEGTIYTAAQKIEDAGGSALPLVLDVRNSEEIERAVSRAAEHFGGIDICINNASAISLTGAIETEPKRFDLMHQINVRGTFLVSRACVPHLLRAANPHILTLSPPLQLKGEWFGQYNAYAISKFAMSMCALGFAEEFRGEGVASNALWPITTIDTAAVRFVVGDDRKWGSSRTPEIMADAAYAIVNKPAREFTGQFLLDELVLRSVGTTDFDKYATDPSVPLRPDLFVSDAALQAAAPTRFASL